MPVGTTDTRIEHNAFQDANRNPTLIGVSGTVGTADTTGTAEIVKVGVNPSTGAMYVQDLSGAAGTSTIQGSVNVFAGTQQTLGTVGTVIGAGTLSNLGSVTTLGTQVGLGVVTTVTTVSNVTNGTVRMSVGTITTGTVSVTTGTMVLNTGTITTIAAGTQNTLGTVGAVNNIVKGTITSVEGGTVGLITRVGNIGTIESGTVTTTLSLNTGTITTIAAGTQNTLGTVGALNNGSVNILTGTLQSSGTTTGVGVVSNLTNGSVNILTGTITSITNLANGTVRIDATPGGSAILTTHTLGTGGGTFFGTMISPVGAGTYIYLTGYSIIARSGGSIDVGISNNVAGSTGAGVIARGLIPTAGGGIARDFNPALRLGTNGTLAYFLITAGTADFNATYWVGP